MRFFKDESNGKVRFLSTLPSILLAIVPKCPLCLPGLMGLLSSFGISITAYKANLLPITLFFLLITLVVLGLRARKCHEYRLFFLGLSGASFIIFGKFLTSSNFILYVGVCLLILANLWDFLFRKKDIQEVENICLSDEEFYQALKEIMHIYESKQRIE